MNGNASERSRLIPELGPNPAFEIVAASPTAGDAMHLLAELDAHLMGHPYPPESRHAFSVDQLVQQQVAFFVTNYDGQPAGCGGIKLFEGEYGEIKRMFVRPMFRGLGLAKAMLNHLAKHALRKQTTVLRLETGIYETEAIALYEGFGFKRRAPFGEYTVDPLSVYLEKNIEVE